MHEAEELMNVPPILSESTVYLYPGPILASEKSSVSACGMWYSHLLWVCFGKHICIYYLRTDFAKQSVNAGQICSPYASVAVGFINSSKPGTPSISVV